MRHVVMGALLACSSMGCALIPGFNQSPPRAAVAPATPPQPDPSFDHTDEELDGFVAEHTVGYDKLGEPVTGTLDAFNPFELDVKRGKCYRMVLRLAPEAAFSDHAMRGIAFRYEAPGRPTVMGGPGIHGPGGVASGGCPQTDHTKTFDIIANWGSAMDKSRIHDLGTGAFTLQLYSKDISEEELAEMKADQERQAAEQRRLAAQREREEAERRRREEERREEERRMASSRSSSSSSSSPSGPISVSVSIKNTCGKTVKVFYGKKPKFGSGTYSSLGSNTRTSKSFRPGDMIWVVDDSQNGLGGATISETTRDVELTCTGVIAR